MRPIDIKPMMSFTPIVHQLIEEERVGINNSIGRLVNDNSNKGGHPDAYRYDGKIWSEKAPHHLRGARILQIDPVLERQAAAISHRTARIKTDAVLLKHALSTVSVRCTNRQQLRDVLPDCLVRRIDVLANLNRTNSVGYIFEGDVALQKQFSDAVVIALRLESNRLINV